MQWTLYFTLRNFIYCTLHSIHYSTTYWSSDPLIGCWSVDPFAHYYIDWSFRLIAGAEVYLLSIDPLPIIHWSIDPLIVCSGWYAVAKVYWTIYTLIHWSVGPLTHWPIDWLLRLKSRWAEVHCIYIDPL